MRMVANFTEIVIEIVVPAQCKHYFKLICKENQIPYQSVYIDENRLQSECKFEAPTGGGKHDPDVGTLFPHIYGPINISAVIKIVDFPSGENGLFVLPDEIKENNT